MLQYLYSPYLFSWFSFVLYWQCLPHQLITNIYRNYITNICSNSITNICCSSITNTYVVVELLIYIALLIQVVVALPVYVVQHYRGSIGIVQVQLLPNLDSNYQTTTHQLVVEARKCFFRLEPNGYGQIATARFFFSNLSRVATDKQLRQKQGFFRLEPSNYRQISTVTCKEEMAHQLFFQCVQVELSHAKCPTYY